MDLSAMGQVAVAMVTQVGLRVLGAIILWIIGRMVIAVLVRLVSRALSIRQVDATVSRYLRTILSVALNVALAMAILSVFGVETTTFAALIAAAGITGTVREIGLFVTAVDTLDNVRTIVPNSKIFADNIQNFSANPYRRVDLVAQLDHGVDHRDATFRLKDRLAKIRNVLPDPAPDVEILTFTLAGPVLAVRPYCNNAHYWQVYFDTNRAIRDAFGEAGFPAPEQHLAVRGGL
jgi:small conductance mechanosensitive channel